MTLQCFLCERTFNTKQGLWRHRKLVHGPPVYLCCEHCEYRDKRRDNLTRHVRICHPQSVVSHPEFKKVGIMEGRQGGIKMPVSINRKLLPGKWGHGPQAEAPAPATASRPPRSPSREAVISLSPCPISPLVGRTSSPIIRLTGKPKAYLSQLLEARGAETSRTPESMPPLSPITQAGSELEEAVDEPPVKRMRQAVVEERIFRNTYLDGKLVHEEVSHHKYKKAVDANIYEVPK
ncbi:uncharacterized protein LOC119723844 [Patiria miniata]|uniref:C2H2-type domain-containing protein n=1 Tax=Patiria miniata TaxID=46514 RepID=A0A913ZHY0_PATMI|nr:uncharacterized protein LOC119723844 [Patiria miniata]